VLHETVATGKRSYEARLMDKLVNRNMCCRVNESGLEQADAFVTVIDELALNNHLPGCAHTDSPETKHPDAAYFLACLRRSTRGAAHRK
jgi:hypothetical protein